MGCDMCGATGDLFQVRIEGTVMTVCDNCKGYGEIIRRMPTLQTKKKGKKEAFTPSAGEGNREVIVMVRNNYAPLIQQGRERLGLKQEDLAKQLRLKESQLQKFETGSHKPDIETARLLEQKLKISLVEQHIEEHGKQQTPSASDPVTLGDFIKKRK